MSTPIKFLAASISNISVANQTTVNGTVGVADRWTATLIVTSQTHSDISSLPSPGFYTGENVNVGDWVTSDGTGRSLRISAISSQNDTQVICTLEDVGNVNALTDPSGSLDGMIPNGAGVGAFIFAVNNGVPLVGNIPLALPGNLLGTDFASNIITRFASMGGGNGNLRLPAGGDLGLNEDGELIIAKRGQAGGIATLDENAMLPSQNLPVGFNEVLAFPSVNVFPDTGDVTKIYRDSSNGRIYRWDGVEYLDVTINGGSNFGELVDGGTY